MREAFVTDRLVIRDIHESDAQAMFDLDLDDEVMRYCGPRPAHDVEWLRDRIRTVYLAYQAHAWRGIRVVCDRGSGEFLGWVFVRPATASWNAAELGWTRETEEEVGYRFRRSAWGRGIATEASVPLVGRAIDDPETTSIVACAMAENAGSLRVLKKLGLIPVGTVQLRDSSALTVKLARAVREPRQSAVTGSATARSDG